MFASVKNAKSHTPDFQSKDKIIGLINSIETKRNILVYGKPQSRDVIEEFLETLNKLKEMIDNLGVYYE